jgi:hypothetical protein
MVFKNEVIARSCEPFLSAQRSSLTVLKDSVVPSHWRATGLASAKNLSVVVLVANDLDPHLIISFISSSDFMNTHALGSSSSVAMIA